MKQGKGAATGMQADAWPVVLYPFVFLMPFTGTVAMLAGQKVSMQCLDPTSAKGTLIAYHSDGSAAGS